MRRNWDPGMLSRCFNSGTARRILEHPNTYATKRLVWGIPKRTITTSGLQTTLELRKSRRPGPNRLRWEPSCPQLQDNKSIVRTLGPNSETRRFLTADSRDYEGERKAQQKPLRGDPENVTTKSSIRPLVEEPQSQIQAQTSSKDALTQGVREDLKVVRDTFALHEVPREVVVIGGAGLVPYVVTSFSTLFIAWDLDHIRSGEGGLLLDELTAVQLLNFVEPVQVGFGAIILSFCGAIHWGLEFASFGGNRPYRRYLLGVFAPTLAWPTVFMPYDLALLVQFLGFTTMYFADAKMTSLGWAPRWYATYRFLLTFVVGACIVMSLVGRGKIGSLESPADDSPSREKQPLTDIESEQRSETRRLLKLERRLIKEKAEQDKDRAAKILEEKNAEYEHIKARQAAAAAEDARKRAK